MGLNVTITLLNYRFGMTEQEKKKSILIAEDEKSYSHALTLKLQNMGFSVQCVSNGEEALALLETSHVDLLLLDLVMPKMDGFAVLDALQKKKSDVSVFILSNLAQEEDKKRTVTLGAKAFFEKANTPISEIVNAVQALFV